VADAAPPYQSLYRRYRPQRFSEVRGQDHVTRALVNAVREGRVAHGYLFSGPRGTGKTSTARILAKALNCIKLDDGEPCGVCESCLAVQTGSSFDVIELDAASNNGVEAMRELVARAALGTPGRWKVYIVDEVHMLSAAASNTLLKTLEEPPGHVVFVLATTEPQKVLPTIRSRTQHFEFRLLGPDVLAELVGSVNVDAGLGLGPRDLDAVVRRGGGSARDTLSVLDQVAVLGVADDEVPVGDEVVEALCERDTGRALTAVARGCAAGRDPRRLAEDVLEHLRNAFLAGKAPSLVALPPDAVARADVQAGRLGLPALVRAMEVLGDALAQMRDALDPRVTLELALVRVTSPEADTSTAALLERLERLERRLAGGSAGPAPPAPPPPQGRSLPGPPPPLPSTSPAPSPAVSSGRLPSRDELTKAWGDVVLARLPARAKARFKLGRFVATEDGGAVFALPNRMHRERCEECRGEVEAALRAHFGMPVPLRLVLEAAAPEPVTRDADDHELDPRELQEAPPELTSPAERLKQAFPGAEEVLP
jgi:DNA polymerase-3 subunit gamma/tau